MAHGKRTKKWFWRWRNNPLRRRDDIAEAWIILALWALVAVGGTAVGLVTAHATDETLAQLRSERRSTHAVLLTDTSKHVSASGSSGDKVSATVRWTAPDGSARTGRTLVDTGLQAGTRVVVWQDGHGALATAPPSAGEAAVEAGALGTAAGLALTGAVLGVGAAVRWRLDRQRIDSWGREWDLLGPQWGHRTG
ncbi:Rv1733c family protein [Streptomyces canus]|uniref:Rv1733c family protein n=1 Tax=Streptomyces canus TaxID=58343 RepID=UPI0033AD1E94